MTREAMMGKISNHLKKGEEIEVSVAHRGSWNGAYVYKITNEGFEQVGHRWNQNGTLRKIYSEIVLAK